MTQSPPLTQGVFPVPPRQTNGLGIAGFICSLVGVLLTFCFAPFAILGVVGLVLSIIAVRRRPKGLAIAGIVLGLISILVAIAWVAYAGTLLYAVQAFMPQARESLAAQQTIQAADAFRLDQGRDPQSVTELIPRYLLEDPKDRYEQPMWLVSKGDQWEVWSAGEDRARGTEDDDLVLSELKDGAAPATTPDSQDESDEAPGPGVDGDG